MGGSGSVGEVELRDGEIDTRAVKEIVEALNAAGIAERSWHVDERPDDGCVVATYAEEVAIRVCHNDNEGTFEADVGVVVPDWQYDEFASRLGSTYDTRPYIDVLYFAGRGRTAAQAVGELVRSVEEGVPRYVDAFLRLAAALRRLAAAAKDDYVADVIDGTIRTYWFTARLMLQLAELVNANIDIDSLRKKVDEIVERQREASPPAGSN